MTLLQRLRIALVVLAGGAAWLAKPHNVAAQAPVWQGYQGNSQHTGISTIAANPIQIINWSTQVDLNPQYTSGGSLLAPLAASAVLRRVRGEAPETPRVKLTPREQLVLEHLARGLGNKQIGARLGISERTVKFHVSSVFTKLGATNRTEAVTRAVQAGLIDL